MPYNLMQGREPFFPAFLIFSDYGNFFVFPPDMMMFFVE